MIAINMFIIGERIQKRRVSLHLTQQKMAQDMNISFHYLSKIEHGQANMTLEMLIRICQYLEMDLAYVLAGSIYRNEIYGQNIPVKLIDAFAKSSPKKQEIIYQILSTLDDI